MGAPKAAAPKGAARPTSPQPGAGPRRDSDAGSGAGAHAAAHAAGAHAAGAHAGEKKKAPGEKLFVLCRVRPWNAREKGTKPCVQVRPAPSSPPGHSRAC